MKRTFILNEEQGKYVLRDNNPNRKDSPFSIDEDDLKFDTSKFYDYVFEGIDMNSTIVIESNLSAEDKKGAVVLKTIDEISQGVMAKIKETDAQK